MGYDDCLQQIYPDRPKENVLDGAKIQKGKEMSTVIILAVAIAIGVGIATLAYMLAISNV